LPEFYTDRDNYGVSLPSQCTQRQSQSIRSIQSAAACNAQVTSNARFCEWSLKQIARDFDESKAKILSVSPYFVFIYAQFSQTKQIAISKSKQPENHQTAKQTAKLPTSPQFTVSALWLFKR
jgi:hypothetical protein